PVDGATFTNPATVRIQAAATDADGSVTNVQFFDGTVLLTNVASTPYELSAQLAIGSHVLTAVATDNLGTSTTSTPVTVNVTANLPLSVTITNPVDGGTFIAPTTVTIQATVASASANVTNVQFFDGGFSLANDSSSPYQVSADLALGLHTLIAI